MKSSLVDFLGTKPKEIGASISSPSMEDTELEDGDEESSLFCSETKDEDNDVTVKISNSRLPPYGAFDLDPLALSRLSWVDQVD
ncbi:hypothetical protein AAC387_Pa02g3721 [Persea americana]